VVSYGDDLTDENGLKVCARDVPSIYLDVTWYTDWIVQNVDFSP